MSTRVADILSRTQVGSVHSVFQNAVNIKIAPDCLINIIPDQIPPNPRSVVVPTHLWRMLLRDCGISGIKIRFTGTPVGLPSDDGTVSIDIGVAQLWDPSPWLPSLPIKRECVEWSLDVLETLRSQAKIGETAENQLADLFDEILDRSAEQLSVAIHERDPSKIQRCAQSIVGLGTGLTPSGDDLLCGIMVARAYCRLGLPETAERADQVNAALREIDFSGTTVFSRYMLQHAILGEAHLLLGDSMRFILCGCTRHDLVRLGSALLSIGSNSGRYMLSGVLLGTRTALRFESSHHSTVESPHRSNQICT